MVVFFVSRAIPLGRAPSLRGAAIQGTSFPPPARGPGVLVGTVRRGVGAHPRRVEKMRADIREEEMALSLTGLCGDAALIREKIVAEAWSLHIR